MGAVTTSDLDNRLINSSDGKFETPTNGKEYIAPDQYHCYFGVVYRIYFNTDLPTSVTEGNNVAKIIDTAIQVYDTSDRKVYLGEYVYLSGNSGKSNLYIDVPVGDTVISGWVDFTKA